MPLMEVVEGMKAELVALTTLQRISFDWNGITKQHTYNKEVSECGGWIHGKTP